MILRRHLSIMWTCGRQPVIYTPDCTVCDKSTFAISRGYRCLGHGEMALGRTARSGHSTLAHDVQLGRKRPTRTGFLACLDLGVGLSSHSGACVAPCFFLWPLILYKENFNAREEQREKRVKNFGS